MHNISIFTGTNDTYVEVSFTQGRLLFKFEENPLKYTQDMSKHIFNFFFKAEMNSTNICYLFIKEYSY